MKDKTSFEALSRYTKALSIALHQRDAYTRLHCDRVDLIACEIGRACGLTKAEITMLRISSTLHDIGKIGISDRILLKPASLDPDEWEEMKIHSAQGQHIICATLLPDAEKIGVIVRHHHEYFNGAGYARHEVDFGVETMVIHRVLLHDLHDRARDGHAGWVVGYFNASWCKTALRNPRNRKAGNLFA